ncbi:MAG TPA: lysine--tRNA ligase [Spirochaetota bacterium]|jgi:lysyl-tRNA synthetase class 2|nr:lysine--tRNA ligase [Spirochaetota bacterium]HQO22486.1 lysine--tRNA ligase [Spirochaetota bacterium]HQQ22764.1 lysine--tRNA ligase [Spirochaetota bacterium]
MSEELVDIRTQRIEKINKLKAKGINPYPLRFAKENEIAKILADFNEEKPQNVSIAGRIKSKREMGKATFCNIEDMSGNIQLYVAADKLGESEYEDFKSFDLGDIVGVKGETFRTKRGEISIKTESMVLLSKCLRPLPVVKEKDGKIFDEFADKETKYRQRYIDLIVNHKTKEDFIMRSRIVSGVRKILEEKGFLEVETPMMHPIAGGAAARPFITHHNALDMTLYLRIAPELYLKRLVVGGFEKVFEMNRNFRNEGIDTRHNPEFTMIEMYQAYADYKDMMNLAEEIYSTLAQNLFGTTEIDYQGEKINLAKGWKRIGYVEALKEYAGVDFSVIKTLEEAKAAAKSCGVKADDFKSIWSIADEIFSEKVEHKFINPTFLTDYPKELSPLAKSREDNPDYVERFELFIAGREMANAFTELNDPFDQKERFEAQVEKKNAGDEEATEMDSDYITALEYGLPPAGGMGIGIDRMIMLFVNTASIKDTILFPLLRQDK